MGILPCPDLEKINNMDTKEDKLYLIGAGGHAAVLIDAAKIQNRDVECIFDDDENKTGKSISGVRVAGGRKELIPLIKKHGLGSFIISIGDNRIRGSLANWLERKEFKLSSLFHPYSYISDGTTIAEGTVVLSGTVIHPNVVIGKNVIVNTRSVIEHDCVIENCTHISPGAVICGGVTISEYVWIGAGSIIIPNVHIGRGSIIAAGAVVTKNIPENVLVAGNPAEIKKALI